MAKIHSTVKELLTEIDDYCRLSQTTRTSFGLGAMNDGNFVSRLEEGRLPNLRTFERVRAYIAKRSKAVTR